MVMIPGNEITLILGSYLLGCLSAGYYWVRWKTGKDVRTLGSGSVGARNVGRVSGPAASLGTFLLDFGKGVFAVVAAGTFGPPEPAMIAVMLAVVAGHIWPAQLRFHGGKGIATSLGALFAYDIAIVTVLIILFVPFYLFLRSFTLSGLLAFACTPLALFLCGLGNPSVVASSLLAMIILIAHRKNIRDEIAQMAGTRTVKEPEGSAERARSLHHEL